MPWKVFSADKLKLFLMTVFMLSFLINVRAQRLVGKTIHAFSRPYSVDTISKGKISRFTLAADKIDDFSSSSGHAIHLSKISAQEANFCDSLVNAKFMDAIVYRDSVNYVDFTYKLGGTKVTPEDFKAYKNENFDPYSRYYYEHKLLKRSDRYYSSYTEYGKWYIVLFDPKKIKMVRCGCLSCPVYLEPILIDATTNEIYFLFVYPMVKRTLAKSGRTLIEPRN